MLTSVGIVFRYFHALRKRKKHIALNRLVVESRRTVPASPGQPLSSDIAGSACVGSRRLTRRGHESALVIRWWSAVGRCDTALADPGLVASDPFEHPERLGEVQLPNVPLHLFEGVRTERGVQAERDMG